MAKSSLDMAKTEIEVDVEWKAFELRPAGSPPMDEAYKARIEASWESVREMGRKFGVEMKTHDLGVNTRLPHRAYKVAQRIAPENSEAFNTALYEAYFEHSQNIGQLDVVLDVAEASGIDREALRVALDAGEGREAVFEEQQFARAANISGVPAFVFMDKYLVTGVRPPEQLVDIVRQIRAQEGVAGDG